MRLLAPAKINSFLAVGPPDESGYHPLRTVFRKITLADEITLTPGESGIRYSDPDVPVGLDTISQALRHLREMVNFELDCAISVLKRVPARAGLGGGSADAGALLRWLVNRGDISEDVALEAAKRTGADVPFALLDAPAALGEGYGDELTPIEEVDSWPLVLARPDEGCATPTMYEALDALPERQFASWPDELEEAYNDFERVMPPACADLLRQLRNAGAIASGLSGSGSAVWGRFLTSEAAEHACALLTAPWKAVAATLSGASDSEGGTKS